MIWQCEGRGNGHHPADTGTDVARKHCDSASHTGPRGTAANDCSHVPSDTDIAAPSDDMFSHIDHDATVAVTSAATAAALGNGGKHNNYAFSE